MQNKKIGEQTELIQHLKLAGYNISQATLSRRLKKLNISKLSGIYTWIEDNHAIVPQAISLKISNHGCIVIHTKPSLANSLAYFIDNHYIPALNKDAQDIGILGTIAGDDTVLIIVKDIRYLPNIIDELENSIKFV